MCTEMAAELKNTEERSSTDALAQAYKAQTCSIRQAEGMSINKDGCWQFSPACRLLSSSIKDRCTLLWWVCNDDKRTKLHTGVGGMLGRPFMYMEV